MSAKDKYINLPRHIIQAFDTESQEFLLRMYDGDQNRYDKRIKAIGLFGLKRVLDAGCGFGQWSLRLAKHNMKVEAIDIDSGRLLAAQQMADKCKIGNVTFKYGTHTTTGYPDAYFDAVFCYGSIFLTDEERAIKEFYRVLKKGGKLYFNYNGLGTYLYFLIDKGIMESNWLYLNDAVTSIINTLCRRRSYSHIIAKSRIKKLMKKYNFVILSHGPDGHVCTGKGNRSDKQLFMRDYYGLGTLREVLAQKA